MHYPHATSQPITLSSSVESQVYALFACAMGFTVGGVWIGIQVAGALMSTGVHIFLVIAELAIIFSARWWMNKTPLNYLLFFLFPTLSGITITPYILMVLTGYANGGSILFNALLATTFMALAAAVFARTTTWDLSGLGRGLFFALLGLIVLGLLQIFIPALRGTQMELLISGAGVVIFGLFTAYDLQRISTLGKMGVSPFMLALSLYLDIFNLFLMILRFMLAFSGERR